MLEAAAASEAAAGSIFDVAQSKPELSTLVSAVTAAGMVAELIDPDEGPVTFFAPTNDAFAALVAQHNMTVEALLDNKDVLAEVGQGGTLGSSKQDAIVALLQLGVVHTAAAATTSPCWCSCSFSAAQVLLLHVVPGMAAKEADLYDGQLLPTLLEASNVTVARMPYGVEINSAGAPPANVVEADVPAENAVIHSE